MLPVQPLAIPPLPSLVKPPSLSLRCTSLVLVGCCIASSLVAPPYLLRRQFVELPPLSPHCHLSLSRFALLPRRRRCRPTQFAATGLPPPLSRRRPQFEPTDPPPPPGMSTSLTTTFANHADQQVHPNVLLHLLCQHIHLNPLNQNLLVVCDAIINLPVVEVKRRRDGGG